MDSVRHGSRMSTGNLIRQPSDWAAIPFQLLRDVFELQSNALDNCAAACVCTSWQIAVNSSFVNVLHLHIHDKVSLHCRLAQWCAYLAARSCIGDLKLTAGGSAVCNRDGRYLEICNHLNPLACVPADCNSLTVDEHFALFVGDYTKQPGNLQHLAITYWEHSPGIEILGRDPVKPLNNLSYLTQLRSLKVEAPSDEYGSAGLHNFPTSLTRLIIGRWEVLGNTIGLPELDSGWGRESECLRCLAHLEFHMCRVHVGANFTANLHGLTSLSFSHSKVGRDLDAVLKLTNLVCLDLTGVIKPLRDDPMHLGGVQQPWSRFEAWPALCVFKFAGCWLIDNSTVLDIVTVQEVHTDRLAQVMETSNIHLVLRDRHASMLGSLASLLSPAWSAHIVDLHVIDVQDTPLHLATIVNQVLEALLCLQSFCLFGGSCLYDIGHEQGRIVLGDGYSGQLTTLKLQDMYCSTLDFEVATCLTSISLRTTEEKDVSCELILPSSVVRLEFFGHYCTLYTRHAKCILEGLPCLTHVTLGPGIISNKREPELNSSACMPTMPSSLCWLNVTSFSLKQLLDRCAQECLQHCSTGLEYLILPLYQYPQGELLSWVKAARYVRVSDYDPKDILRADWE